MSVFSGIFKKSNKEEVQKVTTPSLKSPKLLHTGIVFLVIWFVSFCTFMTLLVLKGEEVSNAVFASSYQDVLPLLIMFGVSFVLGIVSFLVGVVSLTSFLNTNGFKQF